MKSIRQVILTISPSVLMTCDDIHRYVEYVMRRKVLNGTIRVAICEMVKDGRLYKVASQRRHSRCPNSIYVYGVTPCIK